MKGLHNLVLTGIAALAITCSPKIHPVNDNSMFNFDGHINGRYFKFKTFPDGSHALMAYDTAMRIGYSYFDNKGNDMIIDSAAVIVMEDERYADCNNWYCEEKVESHPRIEIFTSNYNQYVMRQLQGEFNKYMQSIINVKVVEQYIKNQSKIKVGIK